MTAKSLRPAGDAATATDLVIRSARTRPLLAGIECLTVFADSDEAGIVAALHALEGLVDARPQHLHGDVATVGGDREMQCGAAPTGGR